MNYENNNNQKIIGKLAKSSLKANKMRNVFILFTIVLSVTLLMVVTLFMSGVQESEKRSMKDVQHAVYANVTADQIKKLESDPRVDYMTLDKRGTPVEIDNYTLRPSYYDGQSTAIKTLTLTEGSLPEQENEVLVTKAYLQTIGKDPLPGTTLDITFLDGTAETFVVSGIIDGAANTKQFPLILSQTYADNGSQLKEVAYEALIRIKGAEQMGKEECLGVIHSIGENADIIRANMNPNDRFLDTLTIDINSFMTIVFIGLLILTASILVIYGVFYVSVISKIRQYGQLRTLGMTKKQIKKLVHREGILLFAIGAPIGVLLGCIIGYFLKPDGFSVTNTLLIALIVVLINLITIFLSIKKPAKIASAISPIEASRYNAYAGDQKKDTKNLSRKLTPLRLASMNASRNRKKTLITVLSLGIGGILFMTAATYITSFDVNLFSRQGDFANAEYIVSFSENAKNQSETDLAGLQENSPFTDTFKNQILSIPGVKEIRSAETTSVNFDYEKQDLINKNDSAGPFTQDAIPAIKEHLVTGTADYDELLKGDTLLISRIGVMNEIYGWQFEVGDTITLYFYNGTESVPHDFKVAGTLDNNYAHKGGWFMLPEEVFSRYFPLNPISSLIISTDPAMEASVEEPLRSLVDAHSVLSLYTLAEQRAQDEPVASLLFSLVLGLSLFIMVFSLINLINTLITNILSQKQELAMLESMGMTKKQIGLMVQGEGLILAGFNLLITLTLGTLCGYLLCQVFINSGIHYMIYQFPVFYVLGYTAVIIAIPIIISKSAIKSFGKESLVERLKDTE